MRLVAAMMFVASGAAAQTASLKGRALVDSTQQPIAGVTIEIEQLKLTTVTDSLGYFTISGIKPGAYGVTARKIGFGPLGTRIRFAASETVEADLLLTVTAQPLPDVKVETKKVHGKMVEFEERRLSGAGGRFLTQADLEKRPFATTADAIRQLPGLTALRSPVGMVVVNTRDMQSKNCPAAVVVDGVFVYGVGQANERMFDINSIPPNLIGGIEYFASSASIPVKWAGTRHTCGLIAIWTK